MENTDGAIKAFNAGFDMAAAWARRDDLVHDKDSAAYQIERAAIIRGLEEDRTTPCILDSDKQEIIDTVMFWAEQKSTNAHALMGRLYRILNQKDTELDES